MPTKMIATGLGLLGFAVAIVSGLLAGHPPLTLFKAHSGNFTVSGGSATLFRALICLLGCYSVGWLIAEVARRAIDENVEAYKQDHPLEEEGMGDQEGEDSEAESGGADEAIDSVSAEPA